MKEKKCFLALKIYKKKKELNIHKEKLKGENKLRCKNVKLLLSKNNNESIIAFTDKEIQKLFKKKMEVWWFYNKWFVKQKCIWDLVEKAPKQTSSLFSKWRHPLFLFS